MHFKFDKINKTLKELTEKYDFIEDLMVQISVLRFRVDQLEKNINPKISNN